MRRTKRTRRTRKRRQRGGSTIPICIYSHSEFFDILDIQFEYLTKLFKGSQQPIYLFADKNYTKETEFKYTTVLYDNNALYMERIAKCIEQVPAPYCIVSHDNDILIKYNPSFIHSLIETMKQHKIDTIELRHNDNNKEEKIKITDTLYIAPHGKEDSHVFSVQPHIWEKEAAKRFFSANSTKGYRYSENSNVQKYTKENIVTYELVLENSIQSICTVKAGKVSPDYVFIHLTTNGKFTHNGNAQKTILDPLVKAEIDEIQKKYIDSSSRGQW